MPHENSDLLAPRQYDLTTGDPFSESPVAKLSSLILVEALGGKASAIRLLASTDSCLVEYHVDGEWRRVMKIPGVAGLPLVNRLKLMADLEPTTKRRPHQGEIHAIVDGKSVIFTVEVQAESDGAQKVTVQCPTVSP